MIPLILVITCQKRKSVSGLNGVSILVPTDQGSTSVIVSSCTMPSILFFPGKHLIIFPPTKNENLTLIYDKCTFLHACNLYHMMHGCLSRFLQSSIILMYQIIANLTYRGRRRPISSYKFRKNCVFFNFTPKNAYNLLIFI